MTATIADVLEGRARWAVSNGDALARLRELPTASADALITDSPYSSGGAFRGHMTATVKISGLRYCGCGCGVVNPQPQEGRPRQYLEGHYTRPSRRSRPRCGWCRADCPRGRRRYCSGEHARAARLFRLYRRRGGPGRVRAAVGGLVALALFGAGRLPLLGPP